MPQITLSINGDKHQTHMTNLAVLLVSLKAGEQYAVARNGEFVPKSQHALTVLCDGDTLDIVSPVGGG